MRRNVYLNIGVSAIILSALFCMCSACSSSDSSRDPIFDKDPSSWSKSEQQHFNDVYID